MYLFQFFLGSVFCFSCQVSCHMKHTAHTKRASYHTIHPLPLTKLLSWKLSLFFGVQPAVPCYIISLQDILCVSMTWRNRTKEPRASMKPCSCSCSSWQYHNVFVTGLQDLLSFLNKMVKWKIHTMLEAFRYILNCQCMAIRGCQPSRESKGITFFSLWLYPLSELGHFIS